MKNPCKHCPFRKDVTPFLHPERGEELAIHSLNPYNDFPCHETTVSDDNSEDGEMLVTEKSKMCAGFLTLVVNANGMRYCPDRFIPSFGLVYANQNQMIEEYKKYGR